MSIKSIFLFLVFSGTLLSTYSQQAFNVKGNIAGISSGYKVFLSYRDNNSNYRDSFELKTGKFSFKGKLDKPVKATLYIQEIHYHTPYPYRESIEFYLEPGVVAIEGFNGVRQSKINGGKTQQQYQQLQDSLKNHNQLLDNIYAILRHDDIDEVTKSRLRTISRLMNDKRDLIENRFIKTNPGSIISWDIVSYRGVIIDPDKLNPIFALLSEEIKQRPEAVRLKERIDIADRLKLGNTAIDFTSFDLAGNSVALSNFKGKYTLIDFWASWCGPCRSENPILLKAYAKFHDKNFEILGVSLDEKRDLWTKSIKEDNLPWTQVSDLKGFQTIAQTYGISAIPQNLLIDPSGKIIAKNIRGSVVDEVLSNHIK